MLNGNEKRQETISNLYGIMTYKQHFSVCWDIFLLLCWNLIQRKFDPKKIWFNRSWIEYKKISSNSKLFWSNFQKKLLIKVCSMLIPCTVYCKI